MQLRNLAAGIFLFLFSLTSFAQMRGISPLRLEGETYQEASDRARLTRDTVFGYGYDTPERFKTTLERLNTKDIPELTSMQELQEQFFYIRDTRFIEHSSLEFARRLSWLYPDDGCYLRAELAAQNLVLKGYVAPKKVFVFGNLRAKTKNSEAGMVSWWYHVAVAYRLNDVVYIYDPAINPEFPLTLQQWDQAVGGKASSTQYAVCATSTVYPDSSCKNPRKESPSSLMEEQLYFLNEEWDRLLKLHRDPRQELGDNPPWAIIH